MKPGRRALGVAESYRGRDDRTVGDGDGGSGPGDPPQSTLAGAVLRADGRVEDLVFGTCTVGGLDATEAVADCWRRLDRPDVAYLILAGVALAWYNVVDLRRLHDLVDRPVLAVTFEDSDGLADAIEDTFDGDRRDERLEAYDALPARRRLDAGGTDLFVRSVGLDAVETERVVTAYTLEDRPEPLRVAKRAARAADDFRRR